MSSFFTEEPELPTKIRRTTAAAAPIESQYSEFLPFMSEQDIKEAIEAEERMYAQRAPQPISAPSRVVYEEEAKEREREIELSLLPQPLRNLAKSTCHIDSILFALFAVPNDWLDAELERALKEGEKKDLQCSGTYRMFYGAPVDVEYKHWRAWSQRPEDIKLLRREGFSRKSELDPLISGRMWLDQWKIFQQAAEIRRLLQNPSIPQDKRNALKQEFLAKEKDFNVVSKERNNLPCVDVKDFFNLHTIPPVLNSSTHFEKLREHDLKASTLALDGLIRIKNYVQRKAAIPEAVCSVEMCKNFQALSSCFRVAPIDLRATSNAHEVLEHVFNVMHLQPTAPILVSKPYMDVKEIKEEVELTFPVFGVHYYFPEEQEFWLNEILFNTLTESYLNERKTYQTYPLPNDLWAIQVNKSFRPQATAARQKEFSLKCVVLPDPVLDFNANVSMFRTLENKSRAYKYLKPKAIHFASILHILARGHYVALVLIQGNWWLFDDLAEGSKVLEKVRHEEALRLAGTHGVIHFYTTHSLSNYLLPLIHL